MFKRLCYRFLSQECTKKTCYFKHSFPLVELEWESEILINVLQYGRIKKYKSFIDYVCEQLVWKALKQNQWYTCFGFLLNLKFPPIEIARFMKVPILDCDTNSMLELLDTCCSVIQMHLPFIHILSYFWDLFKQPLIKSVNVKPKIIHKLLLFCIQRDVDDFYMKVYATLKSMAPPVLEAIPRRLLMEFFGKVEGELPQPTVAGENELPSAAVARSYEVHRAPVPFGGGLSQPELPCDTPGLWLPDCNTTSRIAGTGTPDVPVAQKCLPNHSPLLRRELASDTTSRIVGTSSPDAASGRAPVTQKCLPDHSPLLRRELASDTMSRIASTSTADTASSRAPVTQKCLPDHSPLLRRELASDTTSRIASTSTADTASSRVPVTQKCLPNHSPLLRRDFSCDAPSRIASTSTADTASSRAPVTQKCLPNHSPLLRRELASDTTSRIASTSTADTASSRAPFTQKCLPNHSPLLQRELASDTTSRIASTSTADTASSRAPVTQKCLPNHSPLLRRELASDTMSRIASTSTADTASSRAPFTQKCLPNHSPLLQRELASDTTSRIASTSTADTASSRAPVTQKCLPNHSPLLRRELASDTTSRIVGTSSPDVASGRAPVTQKCLPNHSPLLRRELASDTTSRIVGTSSPDVASGRAPVTQKCLPNHSPLLRRELASDTTSRIVGTSSPDVASGRAPVAQKCLPDHSPLLRRDFSCDAPSRIASTSTADTASSRAPVTQKCLPNHSPLPRRDFPCNTPPPPNIWLPGRKSVSNKPEAPSAAVKWSPQCDTLPKKGMEPIKLKRTPYLKPSVLQNSCKFERKTWQKNTAELPRTDDKVELKRSVEDGDFEVALGMLEKWAGKAATSAEAHQVFIELQNMFLKTQIGFFQLLEISDFKVKPLMKKIMANFGMNRMLECMANNEWSHPMDIYKWMRENNICIEETQVTDSLKSPCTKVLSCAEVCIRNNNLTQAISLLKSKNLFSLDETCWKVKGSAEDKKVLHIMLFHILGLLLNTDVAKAHNLFMEIRKHREQQVEPDLIKWGVVILQELLRGKRYNMAVNLYASTEENLYNFLDTPTIRILLVALVQQNKERAAKSLFYRATMMGQYPHIKTEGNTKCARVLSYMTTEEMVLALKHLLHEIYNEAKGTVNMVNKYEARIYIQMRHLENDNHEFVYLQATVNTPSEARGRLVEALKSLTPPIGFDEPFRDCITLDLNSVQEYLLMLATSR